MTTYAKPAVRNSWGQTATAADLQDPGNTYASAGWQIGVKPPRQYFNWVLNYTFQGIRYLCQRGIPDWDASETYSTACIILGPDGVIYQSLTNNNINSVPSSSPAQWGPVFTPTPGSSDRTLKIANTTWVGANFLTVGTAISSLGGQVINSQVPVGAVTQWQGSLSIGGVQVTSAVAAANSFKLSNGNYVTPQWSGQSGQPSWLFGSNDGASIFVWNPSNFSVANSQALQSLLPNISASGNSVVVRDSSGSIYGEYFSQATSNNENPSISQIMVTNGADNFLRKASVAAVRSALGSLTSANFAFGSGGYQQVADKAIIQGGRATISGLTAVFFPIAFPHACFAVVFTNEGTTNQIFLNQAPGTTFFQATNGSAVINWIAFGW